jgi:hypothetical protein
VCRDQALVQEENAIALYPDRAIAFQPVQNARRRLPSCPDCHRQRVVRDPKFVAMAPIEEFKEDASQARFGFVNGQARGHLHAMSDELVLALVKMVAEYGQFSAAAKEVPSSKVKSRPWHLNCLSGVRPAAGDGPTETDNPLAADHAAFDVPPLGHWEHQGNYRRFRKPNRIDLLANSKQDLVRPQVDVIQPFGEFRQLICWKSRKDSIVRHCHPQHGVVNPMFIIGLRFASRSVCLLPR